jgi:hypothetical protein
MASFAKTDGLLIGMDADIKAFFDDIRSRLVRMEIKQDRAHLLLENLTIGEIIMSQEMDSLVSAVEQNTTVDQSVLTFLQGLAAQIQDAAGDRAKSVQLAATVRASADAVAAALIANTPTTP